MSTVSPFLSLSLVLLRALVDISNCSWECSRLYASNTAGRTVIATARRVSSRRGRKLHVDNVRFCCSRLAGRSGVPVLRYNDMYILQAPCFFLFLCSISTHNISVIHQLPSKDGIDRETRRNLVSLDSMRRARRFPVRQYGSGMSKRRICRKRCDDWYRCRAPMRWRQ